MSPADRLTCFARLLDARGLKWFIRSKEQIRFQCPLHEDKDPSAVASIGTGARAGYVVAFCHVCGEAVTLEAMLAELGATQEDRDAILGNSADWRKPAAATRGGSRHVAAPRVVSPAVAVTKPAGPWHEVARWKHVGFDGRVYDHVRLEDGNGKKRVLWEPAGVKPAEMPLYGHEKLATAGPGDLCVITEGEKAADALTGISGVVALGTVTGAAGLPGAGALAALAGRHVVLWPDHDEPGTGHMEQIGKEVQGRARALAVVPVWEGCEAGDDAADFVARYGKEAVAGLLAKATPFVAWSGEQVETRRGWVTFSAADILTREIPPIESFLGDGLLPAGQLAVFHGKTGAGKSFLVSVGLAAAIASGREWFGIPTVQAPVMVLAYEMPLRRIQDYLRRWGFDPDAIPDLWFMPAESLKKPLRFSEPEAIKDLIMLMQQRGVRVLIPDPLSRFLSGPEDAEHIVPVLEGMQEIAGTCNASVPFVHHDRKGLPGTKEDDETDRIRGPGQLTTHPVSLCSIIKHPSKLRRLNFHKANFGGGSEEPFWLQPGTPPELCDAPDVLSTKGKKSRQTKLANFMRCNPEGITRQQGMEHINVSQQTFERYMAELPTRNLRPLGDDGLYVLVEKGPSNDY